MCKHGDMFSLQILIGRKEERRVNALALGAEEGRG